MPETVEECRELREWAEQQPKEAFPPASVDQISRHLRFLDASLPSKAIDDTTAKMRFAVYIKMMSKFSNEALSFMGQRACETLDWFPTVKQCLTILADFRPPQTDRDLALTYCHQFTQKRFEDWIALVMEGEATPDQIEAVPDQWRRIAVERGGLRRVGDGYEIRPRREAIAQDEP